MLELLMPAGNLKKLKTAIHFGADAVYVGGKSLSLRANADNFDLDDLAEGVIYAHSKGKKAYVTANIFARESDLDEARKFFAYLAYIGADAAIISDLGLIALCREVAPTLPIHISTQANIMNSRAAKLLRELGATRIILARELSIAEAKSIRDAVPDIELETFVHGAMCVSYSGRCLLSNYFTGRSANRGDCAQPCRWQYRLTEEARPDSPLIAEEDERGTYLINSKDLNLLDRIPKLAEAGVTSFKVEGRMKSEYYIATVALAYRAAIDEYLAYGKILSSERLNELLDRISHRPYTQGFADGRREDTISYDCTRTAEKDAFIANVLASNNGRVTVEMRNRFKTGDTLTVLSPDREVCFKRFEVGDITLESDGSVTNDAKLVQSVYSFDCPYSLSQNDLLVSKKA